MIILSAAQDLVGSDVPKGVVLLADVLPAFFTKLIAPYLIHRVPYNLRVLVFAAGSSAGMLLIALTPADRSVAAKMAGVALASFASGAGELSFLGLTHYYGRLSLAAWGSGTGAAGIVGAGLYVLLTDFLGLSVRDSLFASAFLPAIMLVSFFGILPRGPLRESQRQQGRRSKGYDPVPNPDNPDNDHDDIERTESDDIEDFPSSSAATSLLAPGPGRSRQQQQQQQHTGHENDSVASQLRANLRRARSLFFPYMLPLFLVYVAEYTINQGIAPVLLFPLEESPFTEFRDFYPMYGFLYQLGVFVSRTSIAWVRVRRLYLPSFLQVGNVALLTLHALLMNNFLPSVYLVFVIVFWEGLLGGAVYVNTFADIMEEVDPSDREFSLGATSVSDSAGICTAGFLGMAMEVWLCNWQVRHGRDWCKQIGVSANGN